MIEEAERKIYKISTSAIGWTIVFLVGIAEFLIGYLTATLPIGRWWTVNGWFIGYIWMFLFASTLARILGPKFRLNAAQLSAIIIPAYLAAGKNWIATNTGECKFFDQVACFFHPNVLMLNRLPTLQQYYSNAGLPPFFTIYSQEALELAWSGLQPGTSIPWGVWIGPITYWSLVFIASALTQWFIVSVILGPVWVDEERLVFPMALPAVYAVNTYTNRDERGRSALFKLREQRIFWIGICIGVAVSLPFYVVRFLAPAFEITGGFGVGAYWFNYIPITESVLPGAWIGGNLFLPLLLWLILCPYETLISFLLGWLIFCVIYPTIVHRAGIYPWSPGENFMWGGDFYGPPLPLGLIVHNGMIIGLALWYLWSARHRFIAGFRAITGKSYGELTDKGFPMRTAFWGLILSHLLWIAIWVAGNVPIIPAISLLIFVDIYNVVVARNVSVFGPWGVSCGDEIWENAWLAGPLSGAWGWEPQQGNPGLTAFALAARGYAYCPSQSNCGMGASTLAQIYKLGRDTGTDVKHLFMWVTMFIIVAIPIYITFDVWLIHHMGFENLNVAGQAALAFNAPSAALSLGITSITPWFGRVNIIEWSVWSIPGIILAIVLQLLKMKFTWFIIDPLMIVAGSYPHGAYMWPCALIALIVKYVLYRALGARRTAAIILPLVSGLCLGMGLFYIIGGIVVWSEAMSNIAANWR